VIAKTLQGQGLESLIAMAKVFPKNDLVIMFFFFCYLVASIEVHNTCVKKWEILFLSKRTFLRLSMSNFLTKLAYVLQVAMTPRNENLEKKVRHNQMINLKFVVSIYNYISMFRNMVSIL
jgi:hypothetical protein